MSYDDYPTAEEIREDNERLLSNFEDYLLFNNYDVWWMEETRKNFLDKQTMDKATSKRLDQKEIIKRIWDHFSKWVNEHSTRGLTDVLDFSQYDRYVDCWSITVNGKTIVNPSMDQLVMEYSNSNE